MNSGYRGAPRGSHLPATVPLRGDSRSMDCAAILWQAWDPGRSFSILDCCSVAQSRPILGDPMDCSPLGFLVLHHLLELSQTHAHRVGDAIQPSHTLSTPSSPAFSVSQH